MISKNRLAIFKYETMFEYNILSKSQLSSTLAANLISTQYLLEVFFDLSQAAQGVEFLPDDQTLSNE